MKQFSKSEISKMNQHTQRAFAGIEEMGRRLKFSYWIKGCLNRNFGWFKKFSEKQLDYYKNKYPLL